MQPWQRRSFRVHVRDPPSAHAQRGSHAARRPEERGSSGDTPEPPLSSVDAPGGCGRSRRVVLTSASNLHGRDEMPDYDIIAVGGGVGGSAIAKAMAEAGYNVLVVERETSFKDRVRGEWMAPWGAAEAKKLGVYDAIISSGGKDTPRIAAQAGPAKLPVRDYVTESALGMSPVTMYHPAMQEGLIEAAAAAGAEVRRGVKVKAVRPGKQPEVDIESDSGTETVTARLVVGADGRNSMVRKWGGFESREEQPGNVLSGVLLDNVDMSADEATIVFNPFVGKVVFVFPQGRGRARAYLGWRSDVGVNLSGDGDLPKFIQMSIDRAPRCVV